MRNYELKTNLLYIHSVLGYFFKFFYLGYKNIFFLRRRRNMNNPMFGLLKSLNKQKTPKGNKTYDIMSPYKALTEI